MLSLIEINRLKNKANLRGRNHMSGTSRGARLGHEREVIQNHFFLAVEFWKFIFIFNINLSYFK